MPLNENEQHLTIRFNESEQHLNTSILPDNLNSTTPPRRGCEPLIIKLNESEQQINKSTIKPPT